MVAKLNPLLLLVVLVSLQGWWCHGCWEEERFALLQIKSSFPVDDSSDILKSWMEGNSDCCRWECVVCNNTTGRVTKLDLLFGGDWTHNCYLNASYLLALEDLESLSVRFSCLAGFVIDEGLGSRLSRMSKLMLLDLSYNNLTDTDNIFQFLSGLPSLRSLDLAVNSLTGSIHYGGFETLSSRLSKLEVIDLSYNNLNDNIFLHLSGFSSLKSLNLAQNQLTGSISQGFEGQSLNDSKTSFQYLSGLSSLKHLNLGDNQLRRPILSMEMPNLRNLEDLILDGNPLEKSFVQSLGALSNSLKFLSLSSGLRDLKNFLVEGICEFKKLEELVLSWNELQGMIPSCLTNMTSLKLLDLSNNFFTGNIASSPLPRLTSLVYLSISNNSFQVPTSFNSFANNSNLEFILADDNELVSDTDSLQTLPPKFELTVFTLSNRRLGRLNVTLPSFLCHQYDLRVIDLSCINFGGNFPSWLLESNRRLEMVFLRNNSFVGSFRLPSHPRPETRILDLRNNNLQGHIPANINLTFPNREMLTLAFNDLDGKIPDSLSYMTNLFFLDLSHNRLSGQIPQQIRVSEFVKFSYNNLGGQISSSFSNNSELKFLYLDGNNFVGNLPNISLNNYLGILSASNNKFSGELPRWMGNVSEYLLGIDLSNNLLEGSIPQEFCKLSRLEFLLLSGNNLSGSIPSCFSPPFIRHVHLQKNRIGGPMTNVFNRSFMLTTLDLSHNELTGTLPIDWLANASALQILLLSNNSFHGEIPIQLCEMNQLSLLDLSLNNLSGSMPPCLGNLTFGESNEKSAMSVGFAISPSSQTFSNLSLRFKYSFRSSVDYMYDEIEASHMVNFMTKRMSLTYSGHTLDLMSGIDLSFNQFDGEIPKELGNLGKIHALNLSHNNLIGSIPLTLSNLKEIESLDLSCNNLSGNIPFQLIQLNFLETFIVAHNNLSGATPERKGQFGTFDESSYEGNPLLCGPPLNKSCNKIESTSQHSSDQSHEDGGFIDEKAFYVSFLGAFTTMFLVISFINPHWQRVLFYYIGSCFTRCYILCRIVGN